MNIELQRQVDAEIYNNEGGVKLFVRKGEKEYEVSEYQTGRIMAKGKTEEEAKEKAEGALLKRGIFTQEDMDKYVAQRCFVVINK